MNLDLEKFNKELRDKSPEEIISWVTEFAKNPIITTNFRPYEVAILHAVTSVKKDIKVIWCDTGYNTVQTYKHAELLISTLNLNIHLYTPKQTVAHRNVVLGVPSIDDPKHTLFTEQVKLEPFSRAMKEHQPDVWFTNLRKGQTAFRDSIGIVSKSKDGILKISPFYHWSDEELDAYLIENQLPNEFVYFDPTKVESNRECGLHS
ncbi:MAG: phosphoadenylylsulfate reductase [Flavobacteriaceae bacterium CG_4_10_14_3_um_filter_31_253]|nr:MAG: phosphoadenylylsulfate reductase [Flavobacteriaceae bacterium CG17_big_fil_post_rev_8_21_14_2_50_31_13]PIY13688.1 MAG: phosphoadenylylsulfate reductase [Flavobacteriaceae bacterium CG_4_10_14_3_um_filter_31_253]PIZ10532.1 MAG: phosphoadenylylsulfate reductase [Flavobacteriaceae bacterium CG_4_10_14_0_8_um_filter_31_99]PJC10481.1 MAG: phosphoadenylylsulfate reductase [Flavobacteriaceae bacterium CG_4_9_14_0_8_um_filter_31_91]